MDPGRATGAHRRARKQRIRKRNEDTESGYDTDFEQPSRTENLQTESRPYDTSGPIFKARGYRTIPYITRLYDGTEIHSKDESKVYFD